MFWFKVPDIGECAHCGSFDITWVNATEPAERPRFECGDCGHVWAYWATRRVVRLCAVVSLLAVGVGVFLFWLGLYSDPAASEPDRFVRYVYLCLAGVVILVAGGAFFGTLASQLYYVFHRGRIRRREEVPGTDEAGRRLDRGT